MNYNDEYNNNENESSNQMSTTHFNNRNNFANERLNGIRNGVPNNRNFNRNNPYANLNSEESKARARDDLNTVSKNDNNQNNNSNTNNKKTNENGNIQNVPNSTGNKFGRSGIANNLRNLLNTIPSNLNNAKDEAVKQAGDKLKKATNPYAKAAGYAMSIAQKRKEKKEQEEKEETEENNHEENIEESNNEEHQEKRTQQILKKILPIMMIIASILLVLLLFMAVLSPAVTAYSWFTSLFHHKDENSSEYMIYSERDEQNRQAELAFNNAIRGSSDGSIKGIIVEYQEKYGVTIDWYLLNALITYRYTYDTNNLYSNDDSGDLDEEELNKMLEDLENSSGTEESTDASENTNNSVDYTAAQKKIEAFATLMVVKNGNTYVTDKEKNGVVYNNVLNSSTFTKYYKSMFGDESDESKRKLLDNIYDYAEGAREFFEENNNAVSGGVIGSSSIIHLQTCKQSYTTKNVNGVTVYDNPSWSEGTEYPDYLDVKDYLKGVVSREIGVSSDYKEAMKAQAIAALTYMINDSRSGFNLKSGEMYFPSGTCRQATCSPTYGCTSVVESTSASPVLHTFYAGQNRFSGGSSYGPINETDNAILEEVLNDIFGKIMVNKGVTSASFSGSGDAISANYLDSCSAGKCFSQQGAISDAKGGMTYEQILAKYYSSYSFDIIDIQEGLYFTFGGNYNGTSVLNENYHYHQGDSEWSSLTLCGSGAIKSNGCNITSTAMVISVLKNERITPATLQSRQGSISACSPSSRPQMIMNFAKLYGLSAVEVKKDNQTELNDMLSKIATGKYAAVARLAPNSGTYSTSNGHYIAVVGVKTENGANKLLIWDPGSHSSSRDNAWIDVNYLVKYLQSSYSFILIGNGN